MIMSNHPNGSFEFFGEVINPELYREKVKAREAGIAEDDARVFSGDLEPIADMDILHGRIDIARWWLANTDFDSLEEVEEDEED